MASPLLVTGASRQLGRRVVELLLERKAGPLCCATTCSPTSCWAHWPTDGELAVVGTAVKELWGTPATSVRTFLTSHRAALG